MRIYLASLSCLELRLTSRLLTGYRINVIIILFIFYTFISCFRGPRGTEEYREGRILSSLRFGTSLRLKRRNSEKDTQLTISYDIYPHKSLVYMLFITNFYRYEPNFDKNSRNRPFLTPFRPNIGQKSPN